MVTENAIGDSSAVFSIQINTSPKGIKNALKKYNDSDAIAEYVWNGFDAGASEIRINIIYNSSEKPKQLSIKDNGQGIPRGVLENKFKPFYESEREIEVGGNKNHSLPHGKQGVGRLTFFKFSRFANWTSEYVENEQCCRYKIEVSAESLNSFTPSPPEAVSVKKPKDFHGMTVDFTGLTSSIFDKENVDQLKDELKLKFCWFLELNKNAKFKVFLNNESLGHEKLIADKKREKWQIGDSEFEVRYYQWTDLPKEELSKMYFIDSNEKELFKKHTGLNKQGDEFLHSIFIKSAYFDGFTFEDVDEQQTTLTGKTKNDEIFKQLEKKIDVYLRGKRRPYLQEKVKDIIKEYEDQKIIPKVPKDEIERFKIEEVKKAISEIYVIEPRVFAGLNPTQKKTIVGFLSLLLVSDERNDILDLLEKILEISGEDRSQLKRLLSETKLTYIIRMLNHICGRFEDLRLLRELVFNESLNAYEVEHIQPVIEQMTWIFGEEYSILGALEDDFETLLRKIRRDVYLQDGEIDLDSPDKQKEPDILLCRKKVGSESISYVLIELKRPSATLGDKELWQIDRYANLIRNEPLFSSPKSRWTIILTGRSINQKSQINSRLTTCKSYLENGLVSIDGNMKVYIKTWSELIDDFEIKYNFLKDQLDLTIKVEQERMGSAEAIVDCVISKENGRVHTG